MRFLRRGNNATTPWWRKGGGIPKSIGVPGVAKISTKAAFAKGAFLIDASLYPEVESPPSPPDKCVSSNNSALLERIGVNAQHQQGGLSKRAQDAPEGMGGSISSSRAALLERNALFAQLECEHDDDDPIKVKIVLSGIPRNKLDSVKTGSISSGDAVVAGASRVRENPNSASAAPAKCSSITSGCMTVASTQDESTRSPVPVVVYDDALAMDKSPSSPGYVPVVLPGRAPTYPMPGYEPIVLPERGPAAPHDIDYIEQRTVSSTSSIHIDYMAPVESSSFSTGSIHSNPSVVADDVRAAAPMSEPIILTGPVPPSSPTSSIRIDYMAPVESSSSSTGSIHSTRDVGYVPVALPGRPPAVPKSGYEPVIITSAAATTTTATTDKNNRRGPVDSQRRIDDWQKRQIVDVQQHQAQVMATQQRGQHQPGVVVNPQQRGYQHHQPGVVVNPQQRGQHHHQPGVVMNNNPQHRGQQQHQHQLMMNPQQRSQHHPHQHHPHQYQQQQHPDVVASKPQQRGRRRKRDRRRKPKGTPSGGSTNFLFGSKPIPQNNPRYASAAGSNIPPAPIPQDRPRYASAIPDGGSSIPRGAMLQGKPGPTPIPQSRPTSIPDGGSSIPTGSMLQGRPGPTSIPQSRPTSIPDGGSSIPTGSMLQGGPRHASTIPSSGSNIPSVSMPQNRPVSNIPSSGSSVASGSVPMPQRPTSAPSSGSSIASGSMPVVQLKRVNSTTRDQNTGSTSSITSGSKPASLPDREPQLGSGSSVVSGSMPVMLPKQVTEDDFVNALTAVMTGQVELEDDDADDQSSIATVSTINSRVELVENGSVVSASKGIKSLAVGKLFIYIDQKAPVHLPVAAMGLGDGSGETFQRQQDAARAKPPRDIFAYEEEKKDDAHGGFAGSGAYIRNVIAKKASEADEEGLFATGNDLFREGERLLALGEVEDAREALARAKEFQKNSIQLITKRMAHTMHQQGLRHCDSGDKFLSIVLLGVAEILKHRPTPGHVQLGTQIHTGYSKICPTIPEFDEPRKEIDECVKKVEKAALPLAHTMRAYAQSIRMSKVDES